MSSLFITGHTGFIGSHLLPKIDPAKYENIYCLTRTPKDMGGRFSAPFQVVRGSLDEPQSYASLLAGCDTVVHLAAATGNRAPEEYFKVNARGTERLIKECEQKGVKNFLYVSTIAVKFSEKARYYYAQSKEQGEQAVKKSRLRYAIVRPTIVIGKEADIWKTLSSLARKPVLLMFGDGTTKIQPIYIDDLINCLLVILNENLFSNETFELGGPEKVTFELFLKKIHHLYHQKDPSVVHLPLKPILSVLSFIEDRFRSTLPVSTGQFAAFNNDGTIEVNRIFNQSAPHMKSVDAMLKQVMSK